MTNRYPSYKVVLCDNQKVKLAKAYQDKSPIALRLSKGELIGNNKNDVNKNTTQEDTKAMASGVGVGVGVVLQDKREISVIGPPGGGGAGSHGPKGDKGDTRAQGPKCNKGDTSA